MSIKSKSNHNLLREREEYKKTNNNKKENVKFAPIVATLKTLIQLNLEPKLIMMSE